MPLGAAAIRLLAVFCEDADLRPIFARGRSFAGIRKEGAPRF